MVKVVIFILFLFGIGYLVYRYDLVAKFQEYITLKHMARLSSSAFVDNGLIPSVYTCDGMAVNPPLDITDIPGTAQSLVLIVEDPDAPHMSYTHWVVYNIPANTTNIPEKGIPPSAVEGLSTSGTVGYDAPCPPTGTHRYVFTLYVLDATLALPEGVTKDAVDTAMQGHVIDKAQLIGRYTKNQ